MNRKQKRVLICGLVLVVLAGLYPPWRFVLHGPYGTSASRDVGHWVSAPSYPDYYQRFPNDDFYNSRPTWVEAKIDIQALAIDWTILTISTLALLLLLRYPSQGSRKK
jgi:hypothetical protein